MSRHIEEPAHRVPVVHEADVVAAGEGTAKVFNDRKRFEELGLA